MITNLLNGPESLAKALVAMITLVMITVLLLYTVKDAKASLTLRDRFFRFTTYSIISGAAIAISISIL